LVSKPLEGTRAQPPLDLANLDDLVPRYLSDVRRIRRSGDNEYHVVLWRTGNAQKVPCYLDFDTTAFRIARGPQDRTPEPINFIGQAHQGYPGPGQPRRPALGRLRPTISITGHNLYEIDAERSQRKCARPVRRIGGHRFGTATTDVPQGFRRHLGR
jgi:hypothetical protein